MTRGTMKKLSYLILLLQILKGIHGEDHFEGFLDDLIKEWNLQSPTIVVQVGPPDICLTSQWVLCIFGKMDFLSTFSTSAFGLEQDLLLPLVNFVMREIESN